MENEFKDGDIVVLKSGGPNMTVEVASTYMTGHVFCSWFDAKGQVHEKQFQPEALKLAEPAKFGLAG